MNGVNDESWATAVGRRDFLRSIAGAFVLAAVPSILEEPFTIGILEHTPATGFDDGIRMGLSEASRAATLFRRKPMTIARARDAGVLVKAGASVIAGSHPYAEAVRVARECRTRQVVYLNCGARSDDFRKECNEFLFHIE